MFSLILQGRGSSEVTDVAVLFAALPYTRALDLELCGDDFSGIGNPEYQRRVRFSGDARDTIVAALGDHVIGARPFAVPSCGLWEFGQQGGRQGGYGNAASRIINKGRPPHHA
jgi:hypothetical protein